MNTLSSILFDDGFKEIENLKWLPWVGENYTNSQDLKRILIVGESHFGKVIEGIENNNFSREKIKKFVDDNERWKFFKNIEKLMISDGSNDAEKRKQFWNSVSFYNFVQRPMSNNKQRPSPEDFINSWKVFFEVITILQPNFCLFCGVTASKYLPVELFNSTGIKLTYHIKRNRTTPVSTKIKLENGRKVPVAFIKHPSQPFTRKIWVEFLDKYFVEIAKGEDLF